MKALDTNILARFLTQDDLGQYKKVLAAFLVAEKNGDHFYVTEVVLLELIWLLGYVYKYERVEILSAIKKLLSMSLFIFENHSVAEEFLLLAGEFKADLSDLWIGLSAQANQCDSTLTFDRKAAKNSRLFKLLE